MQPTNPDNDRRKRIGSSDAAAICGLSPWQTPLHVYLKKLGQMPEEPDKPAFKWGRMLEDVVAEAFVEERKLIVRKPEVVTIYDKDRPWLSASLDREAFLPDQKAVVECKTAHDDQEWGEPGTDEVPPYYYVQVQEQMFVSGLRLAFIPVLIAGSDFRVYDVPYNESVVGRMLNACDDFWMRVQALLPPPPDWFHPATPKLIAAMHGVDDSKCIDLPEEVLTEVEFYLRAQAAEAAAKKEKQKAKSMLLHRMGDAGLARLPRGYSLIRKKVERKAFEVAETEYMKLSVKKPRE